MESRQGYVSDADMPMRVMSYDGVSYRAQSLSRGKKRYPVVTMVLHFGTKHRWKKAKRLSDMFEVSEGLLTLQKAAEKAGMDIASFEQALKAR